MSDTRSWERILLPRNRNELGSVNDSDGLGKVLLTLKVFQSFVQIPGIETSDIRHEDDRDMREDG